VTSPREPTRPVDALLVLGFFVVFITVVVVLALLVG
jgi:hypothetical protein